MAPMVATATMATYPIFLNILGGIRGCTLQKNPSVRVSAMFCRSQESYSP